MSLTSRSYYLPVGLACSQSLGRKLPEAIHKTGSEKSSGPSKSNTYYKARNSGKLVDSDLVHDNDKVSLRSRNDKDEVERTARGWCSLVGTLRVMEGKPYIAYQRLRTSFLHRSQKFSLVFDHVPRIVFAAPTRVRAFMPPVSQDVGDQLPCSFRPHTSNFLPLYYSSIARYCDVIAHEDVTQESQV